jgi:hypothetical protein
LFADPYPVLILIVGKWERHSERRHFQQLGRPQ